MERDILMKRTSWILGSLMALALIACGDRNAGDSGTAGGAGTETGSPGMSSDTGSAMGAMLDYGPLHCVQVTVRAPAGHHP